MDLIKGDLALIKAEQLKPKPSEGLMNDMGKAIEKLLDTFEVSYRIAEIGQKTAKDRIRAKGNVGGSSGVSRTAADDQRNPLQVLIRYDMQPLIPQYFITLLN
jgi:hypothetical protein